MAMPQLSLLFIGAFAAVTGFIGLSYDFEDEWTGPLLVFVSSILWGLFGMSGFDVLVPAGSETTSMEIFSLVVLGFVLAFGSLIFAVYELFQAWKAETNAIDPGAVGR